MPRNGSGVYSLPAGSTITNGDTSDASDINTPLEDIVSDLNAARPVVAGGTGATSAADALVNLGVTATAAELNVLDGITATVTELNYTDGVTSAIQTQLDAKAPLASPVLTGTPTAPTATAGTDTTQIATTAFVQAALAAEPAIPLIMTPTTIAVPNVTASVALDVTDVRAAFLADGINSTITSVTGGVAGQVVIFKRTNSTGTLTFERAINVLELNGGVDRVLTGSGNTLTLLCTNGTEWVEVAYATGD